MNLRAFSAQTVRMAPYSVCSPTLCSPTVCPPTVRPSELLCGHCREFFSKRNPKAEIGHELVSPAGVKGVGAQP